MYYFCVDFYSLILLFDELPSFLISDCSELSNYLTELSVLNWIELIGFHQLNSQ